jgi:hypothetical protein
MSSGHRAHWLAMLLIVVLPSAARSSVVPPELLKFREERAHMVRTLVEAPNACVDRHDTGYPIFHGCIDWHSSVHGVWSLIAAGSALHEQNLIDKAKTILSPIGLESERRFLQQHATFEMPYGRSWFLRLAVDFERVTSDSRLTAMSSEVAQSLEQFLLSRPIDPGSRSYDSETWALINLQYYATWRKDTRLLAEIKDIVKRNYQPVDGQCPQLQAEGGDTDFMPICTNWAWLVGIYMEPEDFRHWVLAFLPPTSVMLSPVTNPTTPHHHGIDFSRGWGLWRIYWMTGDPRYLDLYLASVTTAFDHRDWWAGDYQTVSHWVAQFGILAIYLTYQDYP